MDTAKPLNITRTTYRVADFLSWQRRGNLELRPPFQRGSVWSAKAKSFFIDSLVKGYPVPLLFIQDKTDPKTYEPQRLVVDGQQRLRTVLAFVDSGSLKDREGTDLFTVLGMHNHAMADRRFEQLSADVREAILNFEFSVHVLPSTTPNAALLEIFCQNERNWHEAELSRIAKRRVLGCVQAHCVWYEFAYSQLDRWIHWKIFTDTQVARMLEVELTSELLMLLMSGPAAKSQAAIKRAYKHYDDAFPYGTVARKRLQYLFNILEHVYGQSSDSGDPKADPIAALRSQSWFYTAFAFVHDLAFGDYLTAKRPGAAAKVNGRALGRHFARRAGSLEAPSVDSKIVQGAQGSVNGPSKSRRAVEVPASRLAKCLNTHPRPYMHRLNVECTGFAVCEMLATGPSDRMCCAVET